MHLKQGKGKYDRFHGENNKINSNKIEHISVSRKNTRAYFLPIATL